MKIPKRTHVYIGRCPDCGEVVSITSAVEGWEAGTAQSVAEGIASGYVVTAVTIQAYREMDPLPFPSGCTCENRRVIRPCCISCGEMIVSTDEADTKTFLSGDEMAGNFMQIHFHKDCWDALDYDADIVNALLEWEWGSGERPDTDAAKWDRAILVEEKEVAAGQMRLLEVSES